MWLPTTLKRQLQWRKAGRMSKQSSGIRNHRSMSLELCGTDDPDIQHAHWQYTAEQFFLSISKCICSFCNDQERWKHFHSTWLSCEVADALSLFLSLGLSLRLTLFCSPSFVLSFFFFPYWIDRLYYYGPGTRFGASRPFDYAKALLSVLFRGTFLALHGFKQLFFFFVLSLL